MNGKTWGKIGKGCLYLLLLVLGFLFTARHTFDMRRGDLGFVELLADNPFGYEANIDYYEEKGRRIRYVEIGNDTLPLIIFIHGAPSSSAFWEDLLRDSVLLSQAKLLAVDRPGYGYSGLGRPEISVKKQAAIIAGLIAQKRQAHQTIILHGSSYGGTVTARIAMDYPDLIDGILLQSASLMPGEEKTYPISYPTHHWALRWLMPGPIRVANAEKLSHRRQLEEMAPYWDQIRTAAIVLHGTADKLIYPGNAQFAREQLINAMYLEVQMVKDKGHDLLWTGRHLLINSLVKLIRIRENTSTNSRVGEDFFPLIN